MFCRDGVEVDPEAADLVVGEAGGQFSLTLLAVTPDTTGIYTCTAENKVIYLALNSLVSYQNIKLALVFVASLDWNVFQYSASKSSTLLFV